MDSNKTLKGTTVLVVHAHPDDEAIFTGITIHDLHQQGARTVLINATDGGWGNDKTRIARTRREELEQSAAILGIDRVVHLGHKDSGMGHLKPGKGTLATADHLYVTEQITHVGLEENAKLIIGYDKGGIYRHPDHLAAAKATFGAALLLNIPHLAMTVDEQTLKQHQTPHLVLEADKALPNGGTIGLGRGEITSLIKSSEASWNVKRAAMEAHSSQLPPGHLENENSEATYSVEWFRGTQASEHILRHLPTWNTMFEEERLSQLSA